MYIKIAGLADGLEQILGFDNPGEPNLLKMKKEEIISDLYLGDQGTIHG